MWLAERGWRVTAVDRSPTVPPHPNIEVLTADLEAHPFGIQPGQWDLVLMSYYLQRDLFPPAMEGLREGGILIAVCLLETPGQPGRFRLKDGELRSLVAGHSLLHYYEGLSRDGHSHRVAEAVIRK